MRAFVLSFSALALATLQACDTSEKPGHEAQASPGVQATGFWTRNGAPPPGAADTRQDGVMRDSDGRPFSYALLGEKLPAFTGTLADGSAFDSATLSQWTVIDVWGIWCSDCRADAPYADALARAIAQDPDLDFISIHVPASETRTNPAEMFGTFGSVEAYMQENGYAYPVIVDTDASLRKALAISWTPTYLLVAPDGTVKGFRTDLSVAGGEPVKDFLRDVARVRAETPPPDVAISAEGVAGLTGETPFTIGAIEAAFPDHEIVSSLEDTTAGPIPVFLVRAPGSTETLLTLRPDWTRGFVGSVSAQSVQQDDGRRAEVGATYAAGSPLPGTSACENAKDSGAVICSGQSATGELKAQFVTVSEDEMRLDALEFVFAPPPE
jgi:thiol-disulfide isomerase/thioredoxin